MTTAIAPATQTARRIRLPRFAAVPKAPASDHVLLAEVAIVFLVTLGTSSVGSAIDLANILNRAPAGNTPFLVFIPGHTALSVTLASAYLLVHAIGVVGLVVYMLYRSRERVRSIGLSFDRWRRDIMLIIPYALLGLVLLRVGFLAPLAGATSAQSPGPLPVPAPYAWVAVLRSLEAGLVEEFVVLAFVITRLRQIGVHPVAVIWISALLRASYHLEYGTAALGPLLFGVGFAIVYMVTRRLAPAIAVHAGYDIFVSFQNFAFS